MTDSDEVAAGIDASVATAARIYDFLLGGQDNFAADRISAPRSSQARANRAFLARAVRYLTAERGISQFLDIGPGLPAPGNTHEVAQAISPQCRVVYADNDRCKSGCMHACTDGRSTVGTGPSETVGHSATRALVSP